MTNTERVYEFLEAAGTYYLATVEGDQPRVRAFGTALLYEGKLYIQTGKIKPVSKQIKANPKVEICAFKDGQWMRLAGVLEEDDRREVKKAMLDKMPDLRAMYNEDDGNTQVLYFKSGEATFSSFVAPSEKVII
ncbi:MAG: pyridoxamine 5'-phosphate oxidase family protein [Bacilli bacterium]|nr:pyridoxamine 5'-phosphate oxidase family protein [Bacilli bacterium]